MEHVSYYIRSAVNSLTAKKTIKEGCIKDPEEIIKKSKDLRENAQLYRLKEIFEIIRKVLETEAEPKKMLEEVKEIIKICDSRLYPNGNLQKDISEVNDTQLKPNYSKGEEEGDSKEQYLKESWNKVEYSPSEGVEVLETLDLNEEQDMPLIENFKKVIETIEEYCHKVLVRDLNIEMLADQLNEKEKSFSERSEEMTDLRKKITDQRRKYEAEIEKLESQNSEIWERLNNANFKLLAETTKYNNDLFEEKTKSNDDLQKLEEDMIQRLEKKDEEIRNLRNNILEKTRQMNEKYDDNYKLYKELTAESEKKFEKSLQEQDDQIKKLRTEQINMRTECHEKISSMNQEMRDVLSKMLQLYTNGTRNHQTVLDFALKKMNNIFVEAIGWRGDSSTDHERESEPDGREEDDCGVIIEEIEDDGRGFQDVSMHKICWTESNSPGDDNEEQGENKKA